MNARADRRPAGDANDADAVRRRQLLLFSVVAAVVLVAVAAWLGMGGGKPSAQQSGIEAEIAGPDAAEKVWTRRSEARLGGIETQIRELQQEARTLRADNDRLRGRLEARRRQRARGHRPPGGADRRAEARAGAAIGRRSGRGAGPGRVFPGAGERPVRRTGARPRRSRRDA